MKINRSGDRYTFVNEKENTFYGFSYTPYPACCAMGILHTFSLPDHKSFNENLKEIQQYVVNLIKNYGINQILIADIEDGAGFRLASSMKEAMPINMAFNKNSGNDVYLFAIYSER